MTLAVTHHLRPREDVPDLWLVFALLKRDATDLVVQKATARILREGITTTEVADFVARAHLKLGADGPPNVSIVLFGEPTAYPHGVPYAQTLQRGDIQDDVLTKNVITIPEVRMSPDLKLATAYVRPLGGRDEAAVIKARDKNTKLLRQEVARRVNLKFAPDIRFRNDAGFDASAKIDARVRSASGS